MIWVKLPASGFLSLKGRDIQDKYMSLKTYFALEIKQNSTPNVQLSE